MDLPRGVILDLELIAIVAPFSRNTALAVGAGMILFHRSVDIDMNLQFRFNG